MKLKKGTLLFLLLTCLTYTTLAQTDYTLQGSDVTIDGNGMITACGCTFDNKRIIIPEKIGETTIEGIGDEAFAQKNLVAVVFEEGSKVTAIGASAFRQNQITELTLPTTLKTIGIYAFANNSLTTLTLPPTLTTIGGSAFQNNSLTDVAFNNTNKSQIISIGTDAFSGNTGLAGVILPEHADGHDVTYKDSNDQVYNLEATFTNFDRSLTAVIPPSYTLQEGDVTVDEQGIITGCKCTFVSKRIIIPEKIGDITITGIGDYAFSGKSLVAVAFAKESQVVSIGINAFWINPIATLTLPTTLTTIGSYAFAYNSLTTLTLPTTLTNIGYRAFLNNKNNSLTTLTFPENAQLTTIGNEAFLNNEITKLSLPPLLETIGEKAFYNNSLTTLTFPENAQLTTIGLSAFQGNDGEDAEGNKIETLSLPPLLESIGESAFRKNQLTEVTFKVDLNKSQIKNIGKDAFSENTKLTGITLPEHARKTDEHNVTYKDSNGKEYLPGESFSNFERSLATVLPYYTLKEGDVTVDDQGIITECLRCEEFVSNRIIIPVQIGTETITGIGPNIFSGKSLVAVAFADGSQVTSIGYWAFYNNSIETLTLPTTVTTIGESAFSNNKLTSVTFAGDQNNKSMIRSIGEYAFANNTNLSPITLPYNGNNNFGGYRDSNGEGHEGATITDFTLGYNAFIPYTLTAEDIVVDSDGIIGQCYCDKFTSRDISIPASITNTKDGKVVNIVGIGQKAFWKEQLTSVVLPEGLISIGTSAFIENYLTTLIIPTSVKYISENAFRANTLNSVTFDGNDTNKANIISIGKYAFLSNTDLSINLPSHTRATNDDFRYKDGNGNEYKEGAEFKDFDRSLYANIPYTLTANDIKVDANGIITECYCDNFYSRTIIIPTAIITTPDGEKTITGIGRVFQLKNLISVTFETGSQVVFIEHSAFYYNPLLESLELPPATKEGYRTYWKDGNSRNWGINPTIDQVHFNKSFELVYIQQFTLTTAIEGEQGGTITRSVEPNSVDPDNEMKGLYDINTEVTLTAKPNPNWRFDRWVISDEENETDKVTTITMATDKTATAHFVEQVTLTLIIEETEASGEVNGLSAGKNKIDKGADFELKATPVSGQRFASWNIGGQTIVDNPHTLTTTEADIGITVTFEAIPLDEQITFTLAIEGQGSTTPKVGEHIYEKGTTAALTAEPADSWRFDRWVISDEENETDKTTTITLDKNKTATAHFVEQVTLTLIIEETEASGEVNGLSAGKNKIDKGADFELKAMPASGQKFVSWTIGEETIEDEEYTLPATATETDISITVTFEAIPLEEQVTLTLVAIGEGSITPSVEPNKGVYNINTKVELTAVHKQGWKFDKWVIIGKEDNNNNPITVTVDVNKTAIAYFVKQVTLTVVVNNQDGGSITRSVEPNEGVYNINTKVELTAVHKQGWKFDKWVIGTDEITENPTTITLDKNKSVTAHFVKEGEEKAITSILTEVVSANPYPNPVTSQITLKAKDGDLIQLFSQKGKQQYSTQHTGNEVHTIDVSTLPVGVYLVRITDAEGNTTTKRILKK